MTTTTGWDGRRLAALREKKGLSQSQLGARLGCTGSLVSQWERGYRTPGAESLVSLAGALETSADYLLGLAEGS